MKRTNRSRNPWADHYTRKAKKDNFAARSVYKLQEIQKKYRILKKGSRVLDLGCARDHGFSSPQTPSAPEAG